jgi:hypothetical protein
MMNSTPDLDAFQELTEARFNTEDELLNAINEIAERHGFGVVKKTTSNRGTYVRLICGMGRATRRPPRSEEAAPVEGKHSRTSYAGTCPWNGVAKCLVRDNNMWRFDFRAPADLSHNHALDSNASHIWIHRKRKRTAEIVDKVSELALIQAASATDVAQRTRALFPGSQIRPQDVRDILKEVRKKECGYRTPHQQFLAELRTDPGIIGPFEFRKGDNFPVSRILWTYTDCLQK